jgi:hypothetical protein
MEGIHCLGHCTLNFVWFEDVCEDAITIVRFSQDTFIPRDRTWANNYVERRLQGRGIVDHWRRRLPRLG